MVITFTAANTEFSPGKTINLSNSSPDFRVGGNEK